MCRMTRQRAARQFQGGKLTSKPVWFSTLRVFDCIGFFPWCRRRGFVFRFWSQGRESEAIMQLEKQLGKALRKCPDCGGAMEPQALVSSRLNFSRWWRCSNSKCQTRWLLPMFGVETEMSDARTS